MERQFPGRRGARGGLVTLAAVLVPDLRPLGVGEIIDVAIKIWRRYFGTLAKIVFVVVAPVEILSTLVAASVSSFDVESFDSEGYSTLDGGALAAWLAGMFTAQLLSGLAFLISSAAVLRAISVAYLGGTPDWRDSLRAATSRLPSLIWLGFLMFGGLVLAAIALILPSIWLGVAWSLAFPILIAEGQRGAAALSRSFRLVKTRWWPTFGALVLAFLLQSFIGLIFGIPLGILTVNTDSTSLSAILFTMVVSVASSVITTPFMAAVLVLIYFDLRVRKEGFDLQLLSQGVGLPDGASLGAASWLAGDSGAYGGYWGQPGGSGAPGGDWPPPSGPPAGGGPAGPGGDWPAGGSGWAAPGSGLPATEPPIAQPGPRFDDPIDPTRPREEWPPPPRPRSEEPTDPTGPWPPPPGPRFDEPTDGLRDETSPPPGPQAEGPTDPTGPGDEWPPPPRPRFDESSDPTRPGDETSPPGDQPGQ